MRDIYLKWKKKLNEGMENIKFEMAAGVLPIASSTKNILVAKRGKACRGYPGHFSVIGGASNLGESAAACAEREFREETGYEGDMELVPLDVNFSSQEPGRVLRYHTFIGLLPHEIQEFMVKEEFAHETEYFTWMPLIELLELDKKHPAFKKMLEHPKNRKLIERYLSHEYLLTYQ